MEFEVGDKILVRDKIKLKQRHDGQKLIIPMNQMTHRYSLRAHITKLKGNCFDIRFDMAVPSMRIRKGEDIPNVP